MIKKMKIKDFNCTFNMPRKVEFKERNREEVAHGLPPYNPIKPYLVEDYERCPSNWNMGSKSSSNSYFLGIEEDHGMWLDFNDCCYHNKDVAILISIQGINPITGMKTDEIRLEKYSKRCPIHDIKFESDRYCSECGYKWPAQNYLSTTDTPNGLLWLDGFRAPDGKIRQYIFTSEQLKGIASQIIGNERTFSIGIAFYESKKEKEIKSFGSLDDWYPPYNPYNPYYPDWGKKYGSCTHYYNPGESITYCCDFNNSNTRGISNKGLMRSSSGGDGIIKSQNLEIGAGALINQKVYEDKKSLDYWKKKPSGMIYINYCDQDTLSSILREGKKPEKVNGFMKDSDLSI